MTTPRRRPMLLMASILLTTLLPSAAAAGPVPIAPLAGEVVLTRLERQHALDTMRPDERAGLRPAFDAHGAGLIVLSYARRLVRIVAGPDGREVPQDIVEPRSIPGSGLSIPSESVAGTATREDLYISLTVARSRSSRPYEWRVWTYAEWRNDLSGMNPTNNSADSMALAWAGGAYVHRQTGSGSRYSHWPCSDEELDEWPSDGSPNIGTAWSFNEFGAWGCPMHWALVDVRIRTDRLVGRTDNLVYKYHHTHGGLEYDVSFSKSPGISISPTKEQWSLALFGTYTH